jgi:hypothetical protein
LDFVKAVSTEGRDEEGGVVVKGIVVGDGEKEVPLNILVLQAPDFLAAFIDDGVLMGVIGNGGGTGRGSEEVGEELSFRGDGEREVGEDRSGQGEGGDDSNWCFSDGRQEVFYWDVSEGDSLDDFLELEMDVFVLIFRGQGVLELRAYDVSLLGGNVGEDVKEVRWGGDDGGRGAGAIVVAACDETITTWAGIVPGVVGAIKVVLDNLVGSGNVYLISVVDLRPVGNRESGGDDEGG